MTPLMSYLAGFGLASGAGAKAFIPVLALGAFHYTDYFELSGRWQWIADPAVMIVLGVLVVVEIVADAVPEVGEWLDTAGYLPKMLAGFIAFAAATGQVHGSLLQLATSGVLGGGTAAAAHWGRTRVRRPFRLLFEDLHPSAGRLASVSEAGVSALVSGSAMLVPPLAMVLVGGVAVVAVVAARSADARRVPCTACGEPVRPGALVCPHCRAEQGRSVPC